MKKACLLSLVFLTACSQELTSIVEQPSRSSVDNFEKLTKEETLRSIEQKYALYTKSSIEQKKQRLGLGDGSWDVLLPKLGFHELPIEEQEAFVREIVSRYGIGSIFFSLHFTKCFANRYDWAVFVKNHEKLMTPAALYLYETRYRQEIEKVLQKNPVS